MRIRREQGLLLAAVALGLWIWTGVGSQAVSSRVSWTPKEFVSGAAVVDTTVAPRADAEAPARDAFLEPSESSPLPPRALPFPELGPLPQVAPPLQPGQQPGAYAQLRLPGGVAESFQFEVGAEAEPVSEPAEVDPEASSSVSPSKLYDTINRQDGLKVYGFIRKPDKYALARTRVFTEDIVFDWVSVRDGKIITPNDVVPPDEVRSIEIADTLRNRIELRRRDLGDGPASLPRRRAFIEDLLTYARNEPEIYAIANQQALEYQRISDGDAEGYRLQVRVLRERGDLAGEWKLYSELPGALRESSLRYRGQGELEARLGLVLDAEEHLRRAVAIQESDPRSQAALARFLLAGGRAAEAMEHALAARRNRAVLERDDEVLDVVAVLVDCHLAMGQIDEATRALSIMPAGAEIGAQRDYLRAVVRYAAGDWRAAEQLFASSVAAGGGGDAALGRATCKVLLREWQSAEAALLAVSDEYPILRHRALAALAFLYEWTGNLQPALDMAERASAAHPRDPYVLYRLGRARRLNGLVEESIEALQAALAVADDLIEAHAELASAYLSLANRADEDPEEAMRRARRHIDLTVRRDPGTEHSVRLRELQGLIRFDDWPAAREAFAAAADQSLFARTGLALIRYRQNRVAEARTMFVDLRDELGAAHAMRPYVESTIDLIDDHSQKEQVRDAFEVGALGQSWQDTQANGSVEPRPEDGSLRITGRLRQPDRPVFTRRLLERGGNFLQAEVTLVRGAADGSRFAGVELATQSRRSGRGDFWVRVGLQQGEPYLRIHDGDESRARDDEDRARWDRVDLSEIQAVVGQPQRLALRVVRRDGGGRFRLQVYWDDVLVHERDVEKLQPKSSVPLAVDLMVEGTRDARVDVAFDDFRLVRRVDA